MKTITLAPGEELRVVCIAPNGTKTKIEIDDEHGALKRGLGASSTSRW